MPVALASEAAVGLAPIATERGGSAAPLASAPPGPSRHQRYNDVQYWLPQRAWGPPYLGGDAGGMATYYASVNRSKRSVAVDLKHPRGARAVRSLASKADVVIENFRPGTLGRMGLGYESLCAVNRRVVMCSLTGYGQWGPASEAAGYDVAVAAEGGLLSITGEPDGPPVKPGVALTDMMTGMHAAAAVLAAVLEVRAGGEGAVGRHLDVSLMDCQLGSLANIAAAALNPPPGAAPTTQARWGSAHPSIVPYQAFEAADGRPLIVSAMNDTQFASLCRALGGSLAGMSDDSRFATNAARVKHRDEVIAAVRSELKAGANGAADTREQLVQLLRQHGLAASPINSVEEAFETDHARGRGSVVELSHPVAGSMRLPAPAIRAGERGVDASKGSDSEAVAARWAPPLLGEHTRTALADWGACDEDELDAGIREGWLQQADVDPR